MASESKTGTFQGFAPPSDDEIQRMINLHGAAVGEQVPDLVAMCDEKLSLNDKWHIPLYTAGKANPGLTSVNFESSYFKLPTCVAYSGLISFPTPGRINPPTRFTMRARFPANSPVITALLTLEQAIRDAALINSEAWFGHSFDEGTLKDMQRSVVDKANAEVVMKISTSGLSDHYTQILTSAGRTTTTDMILPRTVLTVTKACFSVYINTDPVTSRVAYGLVLNCREIKLK